MSFVCVAGTRLRASVVQIQVTYGTDAHESGAARKNAQATGVHKNNLECRCKKPRLRNHVIHLLDRQELSGIYQNPDGLGKFLGILETSLGKHVLEHSSLDLQGVKLWGVLGQVHQNNISFGGLDVL